MFVLELVNSDKLADCFFYQMEIVDIKAKMNSNWIKCRVRDRSSRRLMMSFVDRESFMNDETDFVDFYKFF